MSNIVYHNLSKSPFVLEIRNYKFYFSSAFHKNKYVRGIDKYILEENVKFKNKYKIDIELEDIFILAYYIKCETRGFYAFKNNVELKGKQKVLLI